MHILRDLFTTAGEELVCPRIIVDWLVGDCWLAVGFIGFEASVSDLCRVLLRVVQCDFCVRWLAATALCSLLLVLLLSMLSGGVLGCC